jgi:uncharacterized protein YcbK (DUF882 family)
MLNKNDDCFRCHCCGNLPPSGMHDSLIAVLNKIGIAPEEINSAYRCPEHNKEVGGLPDSQHVQGCAADVDANSRGVDALADLAEKAGADGIGKYYDDCFVHIDTRGEWARW